MKKWLKNHPKLRNNKKWRKMHYKITILGACAPYPRLIYWIASSISQWKKRWHIIKIRTLIITNTICTDLIYNMLKFHGKKFRLLSKKRFPDLSGTVVYRYCSGSRIKSSTPLYTFSALILVDRKSVVLGKECRSRWSPYH